MAGGISVRRMSADRMPTSRGITQLADIPDGERRDGGPELVIRGEHPVIPVPVLPRRRHEVQEVKRREFDDAVSTRAWTTRFLADTAGLCSDAISVERFVLYDSRTRDGVTEHAVEVAFPLGQRDREAGLPW